MDFGERSPKEKYVGTINMDKCKSLKMNKKRLIESFVFLNKLYEG